MRKSWLGAAALLGAALTMGACGSGGSSATGSSAPHHPASPAGSPVTTHAPAAPATTTPTTAASQPPAPAPSSGSGSVPTYQPSTVVSQAAGHTQLTSTDGVGQVTAYYENALKENGWSLSSATKTAASANFVARRTGEGATVAISTLGPSGTSISVSTYPQ